MSGPESLDTRRSHPGQGTCVEKEKIFGPSFQVFNIQRQKAKPAEEIEKE